VQKATQELPRVGLDDPLLPGLEHDRPFVLASWAVLGQRLEPALPAALDADAPELAIEGERERGAAGP
jgi:hypothetical protein